MFEKKILKILLMFAICVSSAVMCFAEGQSTPSTPSPTVSGGGILESLKTPSTRKRMPSRDFIEVSFENGLMSLHSENVQGLFNVQLINSETSQTCEILNFNVGDFMMLELNAGQYEVIATSTDNSIYSGIIYIY